MTRDRTAGRPLRAFVATLSCAWLLVAGNSMANSTAPGVKDYQAVYQAKIKGLSVRMKRDFTLEGDTVAINMRAKKLIFSIRESSRMQLTDKRRLQAISYEHKRSNLGDRHDRELSFDWQAGTVIDSLRPDQAPLPVSLPMYDKISYQEQFRLDLIEKPEQLRFEYPITDGKSTKLYAFDRVGEEQIDTPLGRLNTVKFKRDRGPHSKRETYIWFASDWDYLLARLDQIEGPDKKAERLQIRQAEIGGQPVTGL